MAVRLASPIVLSALYLIGMGAFFVGRRAWGVFLVAGAAAAVGFGVAEPGYPVAHPWVHFSCAPLGLAVAAGPLLVALAVARGRFAIGLLPGATAGLASGLLAMALLHLHCPLAHGLTAHAMAALFATVVGALAGRLLDPIAAMQRRARAGRSAPGAGAP